MNVKFSLNSDSLDNILEGCQVLDPNLNYLFINKAAEKHNKRSKEELLGKSYVDCWPGIENSEVYRLIKDCTENQVSHRLLNEFTFPTGEEGWFDLSIQPIPEGVFILSIDVTEQKLFEREMSKNRRVLELFIENAPAAIAMFDKDMKYIAASRRFYVDYGINEKTIIGKSHYEVFPEITSRWKEIHKNCLNGATERCDEDSFPRTSGEIDWIRWEIRPWYENDGSIGGIILFSELITHLIKSREELHEALEQFTTIFRTSPVAMIVTTKDGKVLQWNNAAERIFGWMGTEVLGKPNPIVQNDRQEEAGEIRDMVMSGETIVNRETERVCKNGQIVKVRFSATPYRNGKDEIIGVLAIVEDITEQKNVENALIESEKNSTALMNSITESALLIDLNGRVISANKTISMRLEKENGDLIGKNIFDFFDKDVAEGRKIQLENVRQTKKPVTFVDERFGRTIENTIYPVLAGKGDVVRAAILGFDITEQRKNEEKIRLSEEKFRMMFENAASGMVLVTPDFSFVQVNPAFCKMVGYSEDYLIGKSFQDITHPEDKSIGQERITELLKSKIEKVQFEKRYLHHDGSIVWGLVSSAVLYGVDNMPFNIITQVVDITVQKNALAALKESEEKFSIAFNNSSYAIILARLNTMEIIDVNKALIDLTGFSAEELKNNPASLAQLWEDPEEKINSINKLLEEKSILNKEIKLRRKNGEIRYCIIGSHVISINGVDYVLSSIFDNTERKLVKTELEKYRNHLEKLVEERTEEIDVINKQLQEALAKEKELNLLKSKFISTASHEFRTPLTSVLSSTELIQKYSSKWSPEKINGHLNRIKNSVINLTKLMEDVIQINRWDSGKEELVPSNTDIYELCNDIFEEIEDYKKEKHSVTYNYNCGDRVYFIDGKQLRLILVNLLSNALKYSPDGGEVKLDVIEINKRIILKVRDQGIGIPDEDVSLLFETFHRGKNVDNIRGTGLGLSIVKNAVDLCNGTITVTSKIGEGTEFIIEIPITG
jgi:PAS domain S-box-containing protein